MEPRKTHLYLGVTNDATAHGLQRSLGQVVVVVEDESAVAGAVDDDIVGGTISRELTLHVALLCPFQQVVHP